MENRIAKIISYITHPLLIATYGYWVLFNANIYLKHILPLETKEVLLIIIFVNTFIIPSLFILILSRAKVIQSIEIEDQKHRRIPFLLTTLIYFACYWFLSRNNLPTLIPMFMLVACFLLLVTYVINLFWKISAHMMGMGALTGSILALGIRFESDVQLFFMLSILISGLTAYARLKLEAHSPKQVYIGYGIGFILALFMLTLFV